MNPSTSAEALSSLQQAQSQSQDPNAILNAQREQAGVNKAQETVTGLRGAINNTTKLLSQVAPSVMGRTASSLVTNAQAGRQIANERAPIATTLGEQTGQYNEAEQGLTKAEETATNNANNIYRGQQDKLSYLDNLYKTLYGKEQDAAKAARDEADRQEQIRQFNVSQAASSARGSSVNAKESAAQNKAALADHITQQFGSMVGSDGKVGNNTWASALRDWQISGGSTREFWQRYGSFVNPKYKSSYAGYAFR